MPKNQKTQRVVLLDRLSKVSIKTYILLALIIFVGFGVYWWRAVYLDPQKTFEAVLNNSLQLHGITKVVTQDQNGQSLHQASRLSNTDQPNVFSKIILKQGVNTTVNTETIGTPKADYVRYTSIQTDQKNAQGATMDFSSVLGIWGSDEAQMNTGQTDGQSFNENAIGIFPFGNLSLAQRHQLLQFITDEKVYQVDYSKVTKRLENSRPRYTYKVGVDAEAYVKMIQKFGQMIGLDNLGGLDPSQYAGSERLQFEVTVDVWSRELTAIKNEGSDRAELYSGHNAAMSIDIPSVDAVISIEELQIRLQNLQ